VQVVLLAGPPRKDPDGCPSGADHMTLPASLAFGHWKRPPTLMQRLSLYHRCLEPGAIMGRKHQSDSRPESPDHHRMVGRADFREAKEHTISYKVVACFMSFGTRERNESSNFHWTTSNLWRWPRLPGKTSCSASKLTTSTHSDPGFPVEPD
jgi:hypothetical protein